MSSKSIGIIIGFLVLIVLSSGCISVGGFADVLNIGDESGNFTELNKTANNTYSVDGVSFKCPDNWSVGVLKEDGITTIAAAPQLRESNTTASTSTFGPFGFESGGVAWSSANPQFKVDIISNNGISEQEAINQVKNDMLPGGDKISSENITIDGENAFKDVLVLNDTEVIERFEYIYFVKNGKTYLITFSAADKDFDKEKKNFNIILNTFKVQ